MGKTSYIEFKCGMYYLIIKMEYFTLRNFRTLLEWGCTYLHCNNIRFEEQQWLFNVHIDVSERSHEAGTVFG